MRLLLVDSDVELRRVVSDFFTERDIPLDVESDGAQAVLRAHKTAYDLFVVDFRLPGLNGLEVLRHLRDRSEVPIMMVGAGVEWKDQVLSLDAGADDFLSKPFHPDELLARVRAILRRATFSPNPARAVQIGELRLLRSSRNAFFGERKVDLTPVEWEILEKLMRCGGRVVTRDELSLHLYGRLSSPLQRSVDTHVSRIRRKLGAGRGLILSVRGSGYQFCYRSEPDPEAT